MWEYLWPLYTAPEGQTVEMTHVCWKEEFASCLVKKEAKFHPFWGCQTVGNFPGNLVTSVPQSGSKCVCPRSRLDGRGWGEQAAPLFWLINLLFSFPGLGVKCINISHESRVGGGEGPSSFQGILPTYFFLNHCFSLHSFFPRGIFSQLFRVAERDWAKAQKMTETSLQNFWLFFRKY